MSEVTQVLDRMRQGDPKAADDLLPLVYGELRKLAAAKMAREAPDHTLQSTALVHEAWLRLSKSPAQIWQNRAHFFGAAAEAMRRILIDIARRKRQVRHGGGQERAPFEEVDLIWQEDIENLVQIHEVLDELANIDPVKAEIVKLRFFVGLSNREIAELLHVSERTVERGWNYAKAWLFAALKRADAT
jgi:RNA polymerase sigma factor (TIGR02999 family)